MRKTTNSILAIILFVCSLLVSSCSLINTGTNKNSSESNEKTFNSSWTENYYRYKKMSDESYDVSYRVENLRRLTNEETTTLVNSDCFSGGLSKEYSAIPIDVTFINSKNEMPLTGTEMVLKKLETPDRIKKGIYRNFFISADSSLGMIKLYSQSENICKDILFDDVSIPVDLSAVKAFPTTQKFMVLIATGKTYGDYDAESLKNVGYYLTIESRPIDWLSESLEYVGKENFQHAIIPKDYDYSSGETHRLSVAP